MVSQINQGGQIKSRNEASTTGRKNHTQKRKASTFSCSLDHKNKGGGENTGSKDFNKGRKNKGVTEPSRTYQSKRKKDVGNKRKCDLSAEERRYPLKKEGGAAGKGGKKKN